MTLWHVMTEYVICFVVSGGEFVSGVDFEGYDDLTVLLLSEATSEALWFNLPKVIGYYKIYLSCKRDVTSSVVERITTYTIVLSECPGEKNWIGAVLWIVQERRTHSINRLSDKKRKSAVNAGKCNDCKLQQIHPDERQCRSEIIFLFIYLSTGLNGFTTLIKEVYWATTKFVLSEQTMNVWSMLYQNRNHTKYSQCTLTNLYLIIFFWLMKVDVYILGLNP